MLAAAHGSSSALPWLKEGTLEQICPDSKSLLEFVLLIVDSEIGGRGGGEGLLGCLSWLVQYVDRIFYHVCKRA